MKKLFVLFSGLVFLTAINAQLIPSIQESKKLVLDHEKIFTAKEITGLDTMLQKYREATGSIVLIATDTLDVSTGYYADNIVNQYVTDTANKPFIFMLLLSRKNQLILASVNDKVRPFIKDKTLFEILDAGIPSFKEKKAAEGSKLICKKAMTFLNTLPGQ
jgi:uncharacterized membrane protein YgcG